MKSNDTISVIEKLVFVYENLNILNNESIREHLDFAIKSIKNMEKEFAELKQADEANEFPSVGDTVWYIEGRYYMRTPSNMKPRKIIVTEISKKIVRGKLQTAFIANGTRYTTSSIGKTVFLTREAAEAALAEREEQE